MQPHLSYNFFHSRYAHESAWLQRNEPLRGAFPIFFASVCLSVPFRLQLMANLKEGDQEQMWEFIPSRI